MGDFKIRGQVQLAFDPKKGVSQIAAQIRRELGGSIPINFQVNGQSAGAKVATLTGSVVKNTNNMATEVKRSTQKADVYFSNFISNTRKNAEKLRHTTNLFDAFVGGIATRFSQFAKFAIASAGVQKIVQAIEFGFQAIVKITDAQVKLRQITGETEREVSKFTLSVVNMSRSIGVSSTEILESADVLAQAGFTLKQVKGIVDSLALTRLTPSFGSLEKTAEGLVSAISQFRLLNVTGNETKNVTKLLDTINELSKKYAVESENIVEAIKAAGGVFAGAEGIFSQGGTSQASSFFADKNLEKLQEFASIITVIRSQTRLSAQQIATGFRTIINRLQDPVVEFDLKSLFGNDFALRDVEGKFIGVLETIREINKEMKNIPSNSSQFIQVANIIGGGVRQAKIAVPLLAGYDEIVDALTTSQNAQNSVLRDAIKAQDSLSVKLTKIGQQLASFGLEIAESTEFKKTLDYILEIVKQTTNLLKVFTPTIQTGFVLGVGSILGNVVGKTLANTRRGFVDPFARKPGIRQIGGNPEGFSDQDIVSIFAALHGGKKFAKGGYVNAMLMPGEIVFSPEQVKKIGLNNLERINRQGLVGVDSVPTVLPHGSYVLNKNSTKNMAEGGRVLGDVDYLKEAISGRHLGAGAFGVVYPLPGIRDRVFKIYRGSYDILSNAQKGDIRYRPDEDENLSDMNVGQQVGSLYFHKKKIGEILKRQYGLSLGDSRYIGGLRKISESDPDAAERLRNIGILTRIHNLPDKAFIDYIKQLKTLDERGYSFDTVNPNNLLLKKQEFRLVDVHKTGTNFVVDSILSRKGANNVERGWMPFKTIGLPETHDKSMAAVARYKKLAGIPEPAIPFASGGFVGTVPGTGNSDSVPANLAAGSYVLNKRASNALRRRPRGYAAGGLFKPEDNKDIYNILKALGIPISSSLPSRNAAAASRSGGLKLTNGIDISVLAHEIAHNLNLDSIVAGQSARKIFRPELKYYGAQAGLNTASVPTREGAAVFLGKNKEFQEAVSGFAGKSGLSNKQMEALSKYYDQLIQNTEILKIEHEELVKKLKTAKPSERRNIRDKIAEVEKRYYNSIESATFKVNLLAESFSPGILGKRQKLFDEGSKILGVEINARQSIANAEKQSLYSDIANDPKRSAKVRNQAALEFAYNDYETSDSIFDKAQAARKIAQGRSEVFGRARDPLAAILASRGDSTDLSFSKGLDTRLDDLIKRFPDLADEAENLKAAFLSAAKAQEVSVKANQEYATHRNREIKNEVGQFGTSSVFTSKSAAEYQALIRASKQENSIGARIKRAYSNSSVGRFVNTHLRSNPLTIDEQNELLSLNDTLDEGSLTGDARKQAKERIRQLEAKHNDNIRRKNNRAQVAGGLGVAAASVGYALSTSEDRQTSRTGTLLANIGGGAAIGAQFGGPYGPLIGATLGAGLGLYQNSVEQQKYEKGQRKDAAARRLDDIVKTKNFSKLSEGINSAVLADKEPYISGLGPEFSDQAFDIEGTELGAVHSFFNPYTSPYDYTQEGQVERISKFRNQNRDSIEEYQDILANILPQLKENNNDITNFSTLAGSITSSPAYRKALEENKAKLLSDINSTELEIAGLESLPITDSDQEYRSRKSALQVKRDQQQKALTNVGRTTLEQIGGQKFADSESRISDVKNNEIDLAFLSSLTEQQKSDFAALSDDPEYRKLSISEKIKKAAATNKFGQQDQFGVAYDAAKQKVERDYLRSAAAEGNKNAYLDYEEAINVRTGRSLSRLSAINTESDFGIQSYQERAQARLTGDIVKSDASTRLSSIFKNINGYNPETTKDQERIISDIFGADSSIGKATTQANALERFGADFYDILKSKGGDNTNQNARLILREFLKDNQLAGSDVGEELVRRFDESSALVGGDPDQIEKQLRAGDFQSIISDVAKPLIQTRNAAAETVDNFSSQRVDLANQIAGQALNVRRNEFNQQVKDADFFNQYQQIGGASNLDIATVHSNLKYRQISNILGPNYKGGTEVKDLINRRKDLEDKRTELIAGGIGPGTEKLLTDLTTEIKATDEALGILKDNTASAALALALFEEKVRERNAKRNKAIGLILGTDEEKEAFARQQKAKKALELGNINFGALTDQDKQDLENAIEYERSKDPEDAQRLEQNLLIGAAEAERQRLTELFRGGANLKDATPEQLGAIQEQLETELDAYNTAGDKRGAARIERQLRRFGKKTENLAVNHSGLSFDGSDIGNLALTDSDFRDLVPNRAMLEDALQTNQEAADFFNEQDKAALSDLNSALSALGSKFEDLAKLDISKIDFKPMVEASNNFVHAANLLSEAKVNLQGNFTVTGSVTSSAGDNTVVLEGVAAQIDAALASFASANFMTYNPVGGQNA